MPFVFLTVYFRPPDSSSDLRLPRPVISTRAIVKKPDMLMRPDKILFTGFVFYFCKNLDLPSINKISASLLFQRYSDIAKRLLLAFY